MTLGCCAPAEGPVGDTAAQERTAGLAETAPGIDAVGTCPYGMQSREVGAGGRQLLMRKDALPGSAAVSCRDELVRALRAGLVVLAVVTIAVFALSIAVAP
jgi:hypothetical protein